MVHLRHTRHCTLTEAEQAVLHCTHAEVGAEVARHWHLGEEVARAIAEHHRFGAPPASPLTLLVRFADLVSASLGVGGGAAGLVFPHQAESARQLGFKPREQTQIRTFVATAMAVLARR